MLEVSIPWCPQELDIDSLSPVQGGCSKLPPSALVQDKHSGREHGSSGSLGFPT